MRAVRSALFVAAVAVGAPLPASGDLLFEGSEFQVNSYTTAGQSSYGGRAVARNADGSFVVAWFSYAQSGESYMGIQARRFDGSAGALGPEFHVNTYTTDTQQSPAVSMAGDGSFVVAWESVSQDGDNFGIAGQRFDAGGTPLGTEFQVNTYTTGAQSFHAVASADDGRFVVVWSGPGDGSSYGIQGQRVDSSGSPAGTEFQVNEYTTNGQGFPRVAASGDGSFVVVWISASVDGSGIGIRGRRFDGSGAPSGTEFQVNGYTTGDQLRPSVAGSSDDSFVAVWESIGQDGNANGIFGRRFDPAGAPLTAEFQLNAYTTAAQTHPSVAASADSSFVTAWQSFTQDGSLRGVFARQFDGAGAPIGTEFQVNTYTTHDQANPSIAVDAEGNYTVVWYGNNQDGSGLGIFGQLLCEDANLNSVCDSQESPCSAAPSAGCFAGLKATFQIKNHDDPSKDQIKWKLSKGEAFDQTVLGDPISSRRYTLCIYDETAGVPNLAGWLTIEPNAQWVDKDPKGFVYKDPDGVQDGVVKASLKTGADGKTNVSVAAKGSTVPMPPPISMTEYFDVDATLTVQLVNDETSTCWTSAFTAAAKNSAKQFKGA